MQAHQDWQMVAHFPTDLLDRSNALADPTNLYTAYHYYLLENLGVGLVRDHAHSPSGYRGDLASEWHEDADGSWVFKLRSDLKWSNGEPIALQSIVELIETLAKRPSRHITILRKLRSISTNLINNSITLHFDKHIGDALLHELSLSDAVMVKTDGSQSYTVTSGPYYWDATAQVGDDIKLKRNPHYMHFDPASPRSVVLRSIEKENTVNLIESGHLDLSIAPYPPIADWITEARKRTKVVEGAPTDIYFLAFNGDHPLHNDLQTRLLLADWARTAVNSMQLQGNLQPEEQLIPPGYPGRLPTSHSVDLPMIKPYSLDTLLQIDLTAGFKEADDIVAKFREVARQKNLPIEFTFKPYTPDPALGSIAYLDVFAGNQKDPIGSWSFLFKGANALLGPFAEAFYRLEDALSSESMRDKALLKLHQEVLSQAYAIPLFIDGTTFFTSDRLDISRWNRFDMRHRYYDARLAR